MDINTLRDLLGEKVKQVEPIGHTLKFLLDDEVMLVDGTGDVNVVSDLDADSDCTIIMSKETYIKLKRREIKPFMAMVSGKIKVKGNIAVAQKLKQLM